MMDRQLSFHGDESGVIATNDDASESKRSCIKLNYYKDEYLHFFCKASDRKAPEINRGYYARVKGMEMCIERFLQVSLSICVDSCTKKFAMTLNFALEISLSAENWRQMSNRQSRLWIRHTLLATPRVWSYDSELHRARLSYGDGKEVLSDQKEQSPAGEVEC